jgi:hypothetical protein
MDYEQVWQKWTNIMKANNIVTNAPMQVTKFALASTCNTVNEFIKTYQQDILLLRNYIEEMKNKMEHKILECGDSVREMKNSLNSSTTVGIKEFVNEVHEEIEELRDGIDKARDGVEDLKEKIGVRKHPTDDFKEYTKLPYKGIQKEAESDEEESDEEEEEEDEEAKKINEEYEEAKKKKEKEEEEKKRKKRVRSSR